MSFEPTEEQNREIAKLHMAIHTGTSEDLTLSGPGGTGKTACSQELERRIEASGRRVTWLASTNKAKLRLEEVVGKEAKTVHGLTYRSLHMDDDGNPRFAESDVRVDAVPEDMVVVCDEAGMVDRVLGRHLRLALPPIVPIVWVGDPAQLGPVNGVAVPNFANPTAALTTVHRQALTMASFRVANGIREGTLNQLPRESEDDYTYSSGITLRDAAWWRAQDDNRVLICWTNKTRNALNRLVRQVGARPARPVVGELLLVRSSNPNHGVFNGQILEISAVQEAEDPREFRVSWNGQDVSWGARLRMDLLGVSSNAFQIELGLGAQRQSWLHADWGYTLTCHAAQGSEYDHVGVIVDDHSVMAARRSGPDGLRRWLYTALSRAKKSATILDCRRYSG